MYIVRRPFKSNGVVYLKGDVVTDPSAIKLFRTKLKDNKIIETVGYEKYILPDDTKPNDVPPEDTKPDDIPPEDITPDDIPLEGVESEGDGNPEDVSDQAVSFSNSTDTQPTILVGSVKVLTED